MKILTQQQATEKLLAVLPTDIQLLSDLFTEKGFDLFLVGGCVRDAFLDKNPKDFDVATNALPEQVIELLTKANITNQLQGADFGVVVARMSEDIEIATFRTDADSGTGSNKETKVTVGVTIEDDVQRRDLTINALFMNLETHEIIDLVGGIKDLNDGVIRTVGDPTQRFKEDNLRKLRAIVRAIKDGFQIEHKTLQAIKNDPSLNVTKERIITELFKIDSKFNTLKNLLFESNLIFEILPNFKITNIESNTIVSLDSMFANILQNENLKDLNKKLNDLKFPTVFSNNICFLIKTMKMDLTEINPFHFLKDRQKTNITNEDLILFFNNDKNIIELIKFKIKSDLSQELMNQGFKGKDLGLAIESFCFQNRTNILK